MKFIPFFFLITLYFSLYAQDSNTSALTPMQTLDTNTSQDTNLSSAQSSYLDSFHKRASQQVKHWSDYADDRLLNMADYLDNKEVNITIKKDDELDNNKNAVDSFFLNDKYLDETDKSYISIRPDAYFSSKGEEDFSLKISAHVALSKSKKRFKLFLNDLDQDNAKNVITDKSEEEKSAPEIGLNYFTPERYGVKSKISIGVRGIYPFIRGRFSTEFRPGLWIIEPIQTLKYSVKDEFEEKTEVFFDTDITNLSLLRLYVSRETKSHIDGMGYASSASIFWTPVKGTGLSFSQYFSGSTKYQHSQDYNADPVVYQDYNGIYNYGTFFSVRQNIFRKWLFYELRPGVNFHKQYDFEPDYTVRLFFDIFIGNF